MVTLQGLGIQCSGPSGRPATLGVGDMAPQKNEEEALANFENDLRMGIGFPIPMKRWGAKSMKRASIVLIGLVMILLAVDSHAVSVTLISTVRGTSVEAKAGYSSYLYDSDQYSQNNYWDGVFNSNLSASASYLSGLTAATATASQNTNLSVGADTLAISGNMTVGEQASILGSSYASAIGLSNVNLVFSIDGDAQYNFTFTDHASSIYGGSAAYVTMQNLGTSNWVLWGQSYPWSGTMGAGTYEFAFWMDGNSISWSPYFGGGRSNADFSLEIAGLPASPVPVPSTLLLLGSGLVGMVGIGRRHFKK